MIAKCLDKRTLTCTRREEDLMSNKEREIIKCWLRGLHSRVEKFIPIMHKIHHQPIMKNLSAHTCEQNVKSPDLRNLSLLIYTLAKSTESDWRMHIQSGLRMKSWGMWVQNGRTWIRNRRNLTIKWLLQINHATINSF